MKVTFDNLTVDEQIIFVNALELVSGDALAARTAEIIFTVNGSSVSFASLVQSMCLALDDLIEARATELVEDKTHELKDEVEIMAEKIIARIRGS